MTTKETDSLRGNVCITQRKGRSCFRTHCHQKTDFPNRGSKQAVNQGAGQIIAALTHHGWLALQCVMLRQGLLAADVGIAVCGDCTLPSGALFVYCDRGVEAQG